MGTWVSGHMGMWVSGHMGAHMGTLVVGMWVHIWVRGYTGMHAHVHI